MFKRIVFTLAIVSLLFAQSLYANSVGVTYTQIIDDRSLGVAADYTTPLGSRVTFESDAQLQIGDVYHGNIDTNFVFDVSTVDLKLLIGNKIKGYDVNSLGREQTVGLAFTLPVDEMNFDVGIGGKNSSPFGSPNAYDVLVGEGFNESDLDGKGLDSVTPALKGLPFKNGNSVNAFVTTGFGLGIFDVDVKGVLELLGEGDKQHQAIFDFKTGGKVGDIDINTSIELSLMSYRETIYRELATITTFGYNF